ncbi:unnamed protein product [Paramecium octaurelia]|uniref:Uncharacterized protein n=1 Tax=Paramecium octaurelia TaxID=43137 RepID=A0A8S1VFG4_PAROT|nr:unnamed protein product [Paramecium octaurelia]
MLFDTHLLISQFSHLLYVTYIFVNIHAANVIILQVNRVQDAQMPSTHLQQKALWNKNRIFLHQWRIRQEYLCKPFNQYIKKNVNILTDEQRTSVTFLIHYKRTNQGYTPTTMNKNWEFPSIGLNIQQGKLINKSTETENFIIHIKSNIMILMMFDRFQFCFNFSTTKDI